MAEVITPEIVDTTSLRSLLEDLTAPVLTIAFPTTRAAVRPEENATKLKSARRAAVKELERAGLDGEEVEAHLEPLAGLLADTELWLHQLDGLVLHVAAGGAVRLHRTPHAVEERVVAGQAPLITPLLAGLAEAGRFAVLAISQDHVRLLDATQTTVEAIDLAARGVPTSVADLPGDDEPAELQHHTAGRGGDPAVFHGHERPDFDRLRTDRLFRAVDAALPSLLPPTAPLVLAGVEENVAHYRAVSDWPRIVDGAVTGDPEHRRDAELRDAAWLHVVDVLRSPVDATLEAYRAQVGTGLATSDLGEILKAGLASRIGTLLVADGARAFGTLDELGSVALRHGPPEPGDLDLVDAAARLTISRGGQALGVPASDLPAGDEVVALLRF
ncbi:MAG: hypothetical protein R6T85_03610 [Egibacteraceae bacterium]